MTSPDAGDASAIDRDALATVVRDYPVRLAVLFGSRATGAAAPHSDVDVAVEFEDALSPEQRLQSRVELYVDLSESLGTDDVDVVDLDAVRPAVGQSALENGEVLVGDTERAETLLAEFDAESTTASHEERMRELDSIIERTRKLV